MCETCDALRLVIAAKDQQITQTQELLKDTTAKLLELASPGANARLRWQPPTPPAQENNEGKARPPRTFSAQALAVQKADTKSEETPISELDKLAAEQRRQDIERSFHS